jgi:hypothetical protein
MDPSQQQLSKRQNVQTYVWGPMEWFNKHLLSLTYPEKPDTQTRKLYAQKIATDFELLMCSKCVSNLPENLRKMGIVFKGTLPNAKEIENTPYLYSRDTLFYFFFVLHNHVSAMLGKRIMPFKHYNETNVYYQQFMAKCSSDKKTQVKESGCTQAQAGYKPCRSIVLIEAREL